MLEHFIQIAFGYDPDGTPALYGLTSRGNIYVGTPVHPMDTFIASAVGESEGNTLWAKVDLPSLPERTRAAPTSAPRQPPTNPPTPPMPSLTSREVDDGK